jgi:pyruvate dehydrogenase E1 component beta subunit
MPRTTIALPYTVDYLSIARLVENAFLHLEAPVRRLTGFDIPFPYFSREKAYLPNAARIARAVRQTLNF